MEKSKKLNLNNLKGHSNSIS